MNILKRIAAVALAFATLSPAFADEQSPYSMTGYGVLNDHISASQRAMGGVGYALRSSRQINVKNPASYAAIDTMTFLFDIGANVGAIQNTENDLSDKRTIGGLDYITMQVPIGKWMGASIGMLPYSSVGYRFGTEIINGESAYQGSGGISEVYVGYAARPVKGLSVGVNAGYLWGNIINDVYVNADEGQASLYERVLKVRDYNIQFGLQYGYTFARKHTFTLGATYTLGHKFHGNTYGMTYDISTSSSIASDPIGKVNLNKAGYEMPWTVGGGLAYQFDQKLTIGVDFTYQPWESANFPGIVDTTKEGAYFSQPLTFADRYKGCIGAEFVPATRGGYFKRMAYRIGAYYNRDYMMIGENNVKEFGITCGFGLPTPVRTTVNIGFEYRHRATAPTATVNENYYMVTLGIALNEVWFVPSRIR